MDFPLALQPSWLSEQILDIFKNAPAGKQWTSHILLHRKFLNFSQNDKTKTKKRIMQSSLVYSPILFVYKFLTIIPEDNSIVVILSDSKHLIHAIIPYRVSKSFELKYNQRITYKMSGTSIFLNDVDFQFASTRLSKRLIEELDAPSPSPNKDKSGRKKAIIVLQINDFDIFQRDQIEISWQISKNLKFVYNEEMPYNDPQSSERRKSRKRIKVAIRPSKAEEEDAGVLST